MEKISIAIATYNGGRYLREQLESLYTQTRIPDEVVVVDDHSCDNTQEILEEYRISKGLRYYINDTNLGVNKNFEKSIRLCTGDYIAICDQDDVWLPEKIEKSLDKIKEIEGKGPACISSQCNGVDKDLNVVPRRTRLSCDTKGVKATLLQDGVSQGCSLMINRKLVDFLKPFPEKWFMYDAYIAYTAACIGEKYNIAEPLMNYRHHANNVVGKHIEKKPFIPRVLNHLRMWKYSSLFEYQKYRFLEYILDVYGNEMNKSTFAIVKTLIQYRDWPFWTKIKYVMNEDYYSWPRRVGITIKLIATFWLPLSTKDIKY